MTQLWNLIAAERGALADDLAGLGDAEWATPSLCEGWSVREVLAHMTATAQTTPVSFFGGLASAGFSFNRFLAKGIARNLGDSPAATLAAFGAIQHSRQAPPGPKASWLGEAVVHAEDIRHPLGLRHDYAPEAVIGAFDFYKGSNALIGTKSRIAGLRLIADDLEWTHGDGPIVSGRAIDLLMAATGRAAALDRLSGPGLDILSAR